MLKGMKQLTYIKYLEAYLQLLDLDHTVLLHIVIAFIVVLPCLVFTLHLVSVNFYVL